MAKGQAFLTDQISANYNENILPYFATFNDLHTWNITDGTDAVIENSILRRAKGDRSMLVTFTGTNETVFNAGGTQLQTVAPYDGYYTISLAFWMDSAYSTAETGFTIAISVNGVTTDVTTFQADIKGSEGFVFDKWNTFLQKFELNKDDEVDFTFKVHCDTIGAKLHVDEFMFSVDDKKEGLVTRYMQPLPTIIRNTQTVDLPSIANNETYTSDLVVTGVEVGDFVEVVPPVSSVTAQLLCTAVATATNQITLIVHNSSGGAVDLGSASFKFKATRF